MTYFSKSVRFVIERNIFELFLLSHELIAYIIKMGKPSNVVIKHDMAKAYDKVEWCFLINVLENIGFDKGVVDKILKLLSNNWYSVLIKGKAHGFFHATRGVKEGDHLSPALFILTVDVLSKSLNELFIKKSLRVLECPNGVIKLVIFLM